MVSYNDENGSATLAVVALVSVTATVAGPLKRCFFYEHRFITRRQFDWKQRLKRERDFANYVAQSFPARKVRSFLVCKDFFLGAASAYIRAQEWDTHDLGLPSVPEALLCCFATNVRSRSHCLGRLDDIPRVRNLILNIGENQFFDFKSERHPRGDGLDETDFGELKLTRQMSKLRDIKVLGFLASGCYRSRRTSADHTKSIWERNVQAYEDYIRPVVSQPEVHRSSMPGLDMMRPLYNESQVSLNGSTLLPPLPPQSDTRRVQIQEVEDGLADYNIPTLKSSYFNC
ncbi:hypothetical protein LTR97_004545 [Elasticomyces elasticus]|uniref:Uncharacterized protein n=1 Tax=Elasticomyces elasticus TaxID=574655 RepID=A0AAN8A3D9_9PEZI|nr:hypothetical protein LTR97_004545 [Elasticomyces elasticus]